MSGSMFPNAGKAEAEDVRIVRELHNAGKTQDEICRYLSDNKIPSSGQPIKVGDYIIVNPVEMADKLLGEGAGNALLNGAQQPIGDALTSDIGTLACPDGTWRLVDSE